MGPPKRHRERLSYQEVLSRFDYFEYRWTAQFQQYHMFNPYTGETILQNEFEHLDRSKSMWAPPDQHVSKNSSSTVLYSESYASRRWGRRRIFPFASRDVAATVIGALIRGYLARQYLRHYFHSRYAKIYCEHSGYYYYHDHYYPDADTTWLKPRLAFPNDIHPYVADQMEESLDKHKYSLSGYIHGPFVHLVGLGKASTERTQQDAFLVRSAWRDQAIATHEAINLEETPLGSIIAWMEGTKAISVYISEYAQMRAAITRNNWARVLKYMRQFPTNTLNQVYGFFSLAKSEIPLDANGALESSACDAMDWIISLIKDENVSQPITLKLFAMHAMHNLLATRAGRSEYLNVANVDIQGDERNKAVEAFVKERLMLFNRFLVDIPLEAFKESSKRSKEFDEVFRPTMRGAELVDITLGCLVCVSLEPEHKEKMAFLISDSIMHGVRICQEDASVALRGLQLLYNIIFRCEGGQEAILTCGIKSTLAAVHHFHSGDPEVMRQCRRVELAIKKDGWRGNVEAVIEKEMKGEYVDPMYLQDCKLEESVAHDMVDKPVVEKAGAKSQAKALDSKDSDSVSVKEDITAHQDDAKVSADRLDDNKDFKQENKDASAGVSEEKELISGVADAKQYKELDIDGNDGDDDNASVDSDITA